ncbi:MAG TPA: NADPH-dependent assimilatory sulfite reductase hemoprotein subunit [Gemmataceae bacterium]|nr:NADPH-dependent assimilatory sulfite reductase hemoprotein subunit [Gemmataceae bacterium]
MATDHAADGDDVKRSAVEGIKEKSRWLRGTLADELARPDSDHFGEEDKQLLKFHGSYQQEDRDARKARKAGVAGKHYMFMVRLKLPGGKMSGKQWLALDDIAGEHGNATLRLTTRQSIQFHGIIKRHLRPAIQGMNAVLISTLGACGDVNRNVIACPAPLNDQPRKEGQRLADAIAKHLAPRSNAYHDVWLNGEKLSTDADETDGVEPIYGKVYLPRKFKTAFGLPHDNCVDVYANDLGFLAAIENDRTVGYNVLVGGGMGRTSGNKNTFPHLAQPLCFVEPDEVVATAEAVIKFFRDHGNRADRKRARLKYVIHDWGIEKVREVFARDFLSKPIRLPRELPVTAVDLHHGWHPQGDGKYFLGLSVENGRIKDEGHVRFRSGLRQIVERFQPIVRITTQQDILLGDIDPANRPAIDSLLNEYGIPRPENLSQVRKWQMACPAIPTCGLAITESERTLPGIIDELERTLAELGLTDHQMSIRMTGCPNGCARPYNSDVGLVGRSGTKYTLFVGGHHRGDRLSFVLQDLVERDQIVPTLRKLLDHYKADRCGDEGFGDWCTRQGVESLCGVLGVPLPKPV